MKRNIKSSHVMEGDILWAPSDNIKSRANITHYLAWLKETRKLDFRDYHELWVWSVTDLEGFWTSVWDFFDIKSHQCYTKAISEPQMPGTRWFVGARLNYAEHALRTRNDHPALLFRSETNRLTTVTYKQLYQEVSKIAAGLRRMGIGKGDRVVSYCPNIPETVIAFLATASIGAIWSSCSPEFGTRSVIERFKQIEPKVLVTADGYQYGGVPYSRIEAVAEIQKHLPTLQKTVMIPYLNQSPVLNKLKNTVSWDDSKEEGVALQFESVTFSHPLWILYSSGTTGLPKPIVHGHGGILLEHTKTLSLHMNLTDKDRFFWLTTTGWMMWNLLIGGLLLGSTVVLYDGHPGHPDMSILWQLAEEANITYFGTSAPYIRACMNAGIEPGKKFDLASITGIGSTGTPLSPEGFRWIYEEIHANIHLGSFSGGTDICTGFVGPCPLLPVRAGEIQCRCLGAKVEAYDDQGVSLVNQVGELVVSEPLPSMPLYLWNDQDDQRYKESYFEKFPGIWRHGDWTKINNHGSLVIYGRSDSTLNRAGIRMGTSEFYRMVEEMNEIQDSLVVDTGLPGEEGMLLLFVVTKDSIDLDHDLRHRIENKLRAELSPRHVPDSIYDVPEIPTTLNGKKMEVPVKRILMGTPVEKAISRDSMHNPDSLQFFVSLANKTN